VIRPAQVKKSELVVKIKDEISSSSIVLFADFRGLTVGQLTSLRRKLKKEGGRLSVYKNTLTRRALDELSIGYDKEFLVGPSAIVHAQGDVVKISKALVEFKKEAAKFAIKGGILDNGILNTKAVETLASLPGREELLAKLVGSIKAPLTGLVASLSSPLRGLVYTVSAIKDKKQNS